MNAKNVTCEKLLTVRITREMSAALKLASRQNRRPVGEIVKRLIAADLERQKIHLTVVGLFGGDDGKSRESQHA